MAYEVRLDVFEGPLDLLLHLITRRRVDIYGVSLAAITEEFLAALEHRDTLDLEASTGFLVVASTLLELKSARLLPHRDGTGSDALLEERDLLLARLVECATYRDAGAHLAAALARGEGFHARWVAVEPQFAGLVPDLLAKVTPEDLAVAARRVLEADTSVALDVSHVAPITVRVRDAILDVGTRLEALGIATFEDLAGPADRRIDVVVRFLAVLELFKSGALELDQNGRFGDIVVRWTGLVDPGTAAEDADEYTADLEGAR